MNTHVRWRRIAAWLLGLAMLGLSGLASADPPSRVARLAATSGAVSFNPAGDEEWVQASLNRPLTTGDRVWADERSRAELQVGGAVVRLGADTDLSILNLDDRIAQMQLTQGVLNVRVRRLAPDQFYEVDTPNLALTLREPGAYRVEVDADGNATAVFVREGQVEAYGEGASYVLDSRQPYRFTGTGLREYETLAAAPPDDFDRWASERDRVYASSASARYVSPDVIGYQDLDTNGTWREEPDYGYVWMPSRVSADWAPYRDGHWAWIDPWGWTWVDDAPWGFAVSHYGRWARLHERWCWVPGPVAVRPYYAPALVAFVGGPNFQISISSGPVGGVAWFPLAPREVYRPAYAVSRTYFRNVNVSNTVVNTTVINNTYTNTNVTNVVYANQRVPGAVVAVPAQSFVQSKPVARDAVRVAPNQLVARPVAIAPPVVPTERSVRGAAERGGKPPAKAIERTVVAREAPPARAKFEPSAGAERGRRDADDARKRLAVAAPVQKPNVKVIEQRADQRPNAAPPPVAKGTRPDAKGDDARKPEPRGNEQARERDERGAEQGRGRDDDRKGALSVPPSRDVARAPGDAQPPRAEAPGNGEQRELPAATPPARAPEQRERSAAPPPVGAPQARDKPATPPGRAPEPRAQPDERGRGAADDRAPGTVPTPPQRADRPSVPRPPTARGNADQPGRTELPGRERRGADPRAEQRTQAARPEKPGVRAQPAPSAPAAMPPQAARPTPAPQPPEPRAKPDQPNRAEPPAPRQPPQARALPAPNDARGRAEPPRGRAEPSRPIAQAPRPAAEAPRPPSVLPAPPVTRPAAPTRPVTEAPKQARPAPGSAAEHARGPVRKDERDENKK